jgi:hypothetical protein
VFALALLAVVIVIANSGGDTSGSGTPIAGSTRTNDRSSSQPGGTSTHAAAARSTPRPTPRRTPRPTPTPRPTDLPSALSALRAAITDAQAGNAVSSADAQDLLHRVDAMSTAGPGPGGGPGNGNGNDQGNGKPKKHGGPPAPDLSGPINDFAHHLDDLRANGAITAPAYNSIQSALVSVRSFAPSGAGDGGD